MSSTKSQNSMSNAWELSLYELHRKPHEMVSDTSAIAVSPRSLHSELMCPICLDLMRNTQTTKECLHRFCQDCITTALRSGNKECPTCRKKLVSKRSLRPDPNFDKLIAKIYPNREELNAQQEKQINRRSQTVHRRKRKAESPSEDGSSEVATPVDKRLKLEEVEEDNESVTPPPNEADETVELQLRPHPQQASLKGAMIKNLMTSPLCTVSHLIRYIGLNLNEEGNGDGVSECSLHVQLGDSYTCLPGSTTLKQISDTYWSPGEKLKLFFSSKE